MNNKFQVAQPGWRGRLTRYSRFLLRWGWFLLLSMILTTSYTYFSQVGTISTTTSSSSTEGRATNTRSGITLFTPVLSTPDTYQATLQLQMQLPVNMGLISGNLSTTLYSKLFLDPDTLSLALTKLNKLPGFKDLQVSELQGLVSANAITGTRVLELTAIGATPVDAITVVTSVYQAFVDNFHVERMYVLNGLLKALSSEYQAVQHDADVSKATVDNLNATGQGNTFLARSEVNLNREQQGLANSIYTQMLSLRQLGINGSTEILQPLNVHPRVTTIPGTGSTWWLRLALSPIVGLIMGLGGALLAGGFSRRLPLRGKKRDLVLPHITALIPVLSGLNNDRLRLQALREAASESLPLLRRLRYRAGEHEQRLRVITVTSPKGREGKSTVATSLALAAAQSGLRTILVDANIDHPVLHTWLQLPGTVGTLDAIRALSTGMVGTSPILTTNVVKLGFVPIGTTNRQKPAGAAEEVLRIDGLQPLTELLSNQADLIIFDAPSLLSNTNTINLVSLSDIVLLIVDAQKSNSSKVLEAEDLLSKVGIAFATVLNRAKRETAE